MNYRLLVNTTDSFEDCWQPFFTLFAKYWPEYNEPVFLNTETKSFFFYGVKIRALQHQLLLPKKKVSWSECLIIALDRIDTDIVLYMQEDYFLKAPVQHEWVEYYANLMEKQPDIDCIHLTDQAVRPAPGPVNEHRLLRAKRNQKYLISCQAALWRKQALLKYLRPNESGWEFEEFGSERAGLDNSAIYQVDKKWVVLDRFEIIPYVFTGIIQGKWKPEVVQLFEENGIEIDLGKRGFCEPAKRKPFMKRVKGKFRRWPRLLRHKFELFKLKLG